ncbi:MAG: TerD family protein [Micromonosporaceae bacterium]|nr:TerD family protein [Micromonosporaceae bacterium]
MSATWAKGQNASLSGTRFRVTVRAAGCLDLSALLLDRSGRARFDRDFVFYNQPNGDGTALHTKADGHDALDVDLDAIPADVERLLIVASLDDEVGTFGALPPPSVHLDGADGIPVGSFVLTGLSSERAVIGLEIYRRSGQWKVRAVGQGYDGGLAELVTRHGIAVDSGPWVGSVPGPDVAPGTGLPIRFVPGRHHQPYQPPDPNGQERLYDQLWGIFEDAARSAAAFESARAFAHRRLEQELSDLVADQSTRHSPHATALRSEAQQRHDDLMARASSDHRRDSDHLQAELAELVGALPATMAPWGDLAWERWQPPPRSVAGIRIGTLHRAEYPGPTVPFILRLPLARPLWLDGSGGNLPQARALARSVLARMLAAYPTGEMTVHVIDLGGQAAAGQAIEPLLTPGNRPIAVLVDSIARLASLLAELVSRVDMVRMAARAGAIDAVAGHVDPGARLLVWHDFPFGLDERGMSSVRFLIEQGPSAGVFMLIVADAVDVRSVGNAAEPVWDASLRLAATPAECVGDPWVGLPWTYTPDLPDTSDQIDRVLTRLAAGGG